MPNTEILVHTSARAEIKQQMEIVAKRLALPDPVEFRYPMPPVGKDTKIRIIAGGDGTQKSAMEQILTHTGESSDILQVVVAGGSQNAFHGTLRAAGSTISPLQIVDGDTSHIPHFSPGEINGERFSVIAGIDAISARFFAYDEWLRDKMPGKMRPYKHTLTQLMSFAQNVVSKDPMNPAIDLFVLAPKLSKLPYFSEQKLYGDMITRLHIQGKTKAARVGKLALLFMTAPLYTKMGVKLPASLVTVSSEKTHMIEDSQKLHTRANLDGEPVSLPHEGVIFVARSSRSLPVAAFVEK